MKSNYYLRSLIVILILTFITVYSCSNSDDDEIPPEDSTNSTPVVNNNTTSTNTNSTNTPSLYNLYQAQSFMHWLNPTDICSVGYDINPYKELRSKACGIESEIHDCKSCRDPRFGIESDKTVSNYTLRKDYKGINPRDPDIDATCLSHIQEVRNEIQKGLAANNKAYVTYVSGYYTENAINTFHNVTNKSTAIAVCKYIVDVKELKYNEGKDCNICGTINEITYHLCKHPSHGVEEKISKSSLELSKQDVERLEGKVLGCKTCDNIKFDILNMDEKNDTQLVNRINCLLNNLDSYDTCDKDKQGIITELKRLTIYSDLINKRHPELFTKVKEHI